MKKHNKFYNSIRFLQYALLSLFMAGVCFWAGTGNVQAATAASVKYTSMQTGQTMTMEYNSLYVAWNGAVAASMMGNADVVMTMKKDWNPLTETEIQSMKSATSDSPLAEKDMGANLTFQLLRFPASGSIPAFSDGGILVPGNCRITLDLNGCSITRPQLDKAIFIVEGELNLENSSDTTSTVHGGREAEDGGNIEVKEKASFSVHGNVEYDKDNSPKSYAGVVMEGSSEIKEYDSFVLAWNDAVLQSGKSKKTVKVILYKNWESFPSDNYIKGEESQDNYECKEGMMGVSLAYKEFKDSTSGKIKAFRDNGSIWVPSGCSILLDLNGNSIRRNLKEAVNGGEVFYVEGDLKIIDDKYEKKPGKGRIIGGYNTENGGGIAVKGQGTLTLKHCIMEGCKTKKNGGAISFEAGRSTVTNSRFLNCKAEDKGGAAFYQSGQVKFVNLLARGCSAGNAGGGLYINNNDARLNQCNITECVAKDGAGIFVAGGKKLRLMNKIIVKKNLITDQSKESNIALQNSNGKAFLTDAGISIESDFDINMVGTASDWVFIKNASKTKVMREIYKINRQYHPDAECIYNEKQTLRVGAYSGTALGKNPWTILVLTLVTIVGILCLSWWRKKKAFFLQKERKDSQRKEDS